MENKLNDYLHKQVTELIYGVDKNTYDYIIDQFPNYLPGDEIEREEKVIKQKLLKDK